MIFVTVGSQKFPFNRLLKEIDRLIECGIIKDEVIAQIGYSDYLPKNYKYVQFIDRDVFENYEQMADIVITHGGTGAIVGALKKNKKVIAVPRLKKYGEHVDNHQLQILSQFKEMNLICICEIIEELGMKYQEIHNTTFDSYVSNTDLIIESIQNFIEFEGVKHE